MTKVLLAFVLPIFISNLFQQFYNVVDIAVIGHILGDNALAAALSLAVTILLTVSALFFLKPLLLLLHTPESILPVSESYISSIWMCCGITFAYNLLSALLRAIGNSRIPLWAFQPASRHGMEHGCSHGDAPVWKKYSAGAYGNGRRRSAICRYAVSLLECALLRFAKCLAHYAQQLTGAWK